MVRRGDHPRIRGEHSSTSHLIDRLQGSSPHTRGAHVPVMDQLLELGIIPAYAGSTMTHRLTDKLQRDHPRIRGEHSSRIWAKSTRKCAYHRHISPWVEARSQIINPAEAGNTQRLHISIGASPYTGAASIISRMADPTVRLRHLSPPSTTRPESGE